MLRSYDFVSVQQEELEQCASKTDLKIERLTGFPRTRTSRDENQPRRVLPVPERWRVEVDTMLDRGPIVKESSSRFAFVITVRMTTKRIDGGETERDGNCHRQPDELPSDHLPYYGLCKTAEDG